MFDPSAAALRGGIYGLSVHSRAGGGWSWCRCPGRRPCPTAPGPPTGPRAILEASRQVDLLDRETGRPYESGIAMLPIPAEVRAWSDEARRWRPAGDRRRRARRPHRAARGGGRGRRALGERMNALGPRAVRAPGCRRASWWAWWAATTRRRSARSAPRRSCTRAWASCTSTRTPTCATAYEGFRWSHASIMFNVCARRARRGAHRAGRDPRLLRRGGRAHPREPGARCAPTSTPTCGASMQDGESWTRAHGPRSWPTCPHEV